MCRFTAVTGCIDIYQAWRVDNVDAMVMHPPKAFMC